MPTGGPDGGLAPYIPVGAGVTVVDVPSFQYVVLPTRWPVRPLSQMIELPCCVQRTVCAAAGLIALSTIKSSHPLASDFMSFSIVAKTCIIIGPN